MKLVFARKRVMLDLVTRGFAVSAIVTIKPFGLYPLADLAELAGVAPSTLERGLRSADLRVVKMGRNRLIAGFELLKLFGAEDCLEAGVPVPFAEQG